MTNESGNSQRQFIMDWLQGVLQSEVKEDEIEEENLSGIKHECDRFGDNGEEEDLERCPLRKPENIGDAESDQSVLKQEANGEEEYGVRKKKVKSRKQIIKHKNKYACPICELDVLDLKTHMMTHTGETPYKCTICNRQFSHRSSLARHRFSHSGERPFECSFCEKSYIDPYELKLHTAIHSEKRDFKCNLCSKQFVKKICLRQHIINIHNNQRDFKCDVCKKEFKRKEHLKRHALIHIGEKSHACADCNKTFLTMWNLQRHITIHEEGRQRKCYTRKRELCK